MPDILSVKIDTKDFERLAATFQTAGKNVKPALARAINHTGDKARTQVTRALVKQIGAKIRARSEPRSASAPAGSRGLVYRIIAKGGFISLKEFRRAADRTRAFLPRPGESAAYSRIPSLSPRSAVMCSSAPAAAARRSANCGGRRYRRELVKDQSKEAFETTVRAELPRRLEHEVTAILRGNAPSS